ncbi:hypothetical protein GUJ93_ZPchr0004g38500 [Zizania palustris]|uniref:Glucose-6-phosphate dehydrogenase NAD-binding domain-containing protein n=1 Tax=Zizania palustris TaxID=103762 RepID=A0A8J5T0G8_ZIZPA|nr:hypothetical protein GUJ93_ZPchr0004g38500 [Zizania palustris]
MFYSLMYLFVGGNAICIYAICLHNVIVTALVLATEVAKHFTVFGYAHSRMSDEELRNMISLTLTCRIDQRENCSDKMEQFLKRCFYQSGQYNSEEEFFELDRKLKEKELTIYVEKGLHKGFGLATGTQEAAMRPLRKHLNCFCTEMD